MQENKADIITRTAQSTRVAIWHHLAGVGAVQEKDAVNRAAVITPFLHPQQVSAPRCF
jgi:hypothetical protein